jgi:tetratricopeptide (TPR) repeat protein
VLPPGDSVACRYHFYRANQFHDEKDWQREREELERAIKLDRTDADVLIAMYRLPEADEAWRKSTLARIRALSHEFQQEIDEAPNNPTPYNQWAWLVANTEGDYQKAIRYSHRSIELIPPGAGESASASFLDTLGRCYYAAGDFENAVKYQRQAVEKIEHMQVMQRQLALFEKALAESKQAENGKPEAESDADSTATELQKK